MPVGVPESLVRAPLRGRDVAACRCCRRCASYCRGAGWPADRWWRWRSSACCAWRSRPAPRRTGRGAGSRGYPRPACSPPWASASTPGGPCWSRSPVRPGRRWWRRCSTGARSSCCARPRERRPRSGSASRRRCGAGGASCSWPGTGPGRRFGCGSSPQRWTGLGDGHGRLRACCAEVVADGRGEAAMTRTRWLWLPAEDGGVAAADPARPPVADLPSDRPGRPPVRLSPFDGSRRSCPLP